MFLFTHSTLCIHMDAIIDLKVLILSTFSYRFLFLFSIHFIAAYIFGPLPFSSLFFSFILPHNELQSIIFLSLWRFLYLLSAQIIRAILDDPKDKTEMWLIFANQTEEDILLRKELEAIPKERFHLWYTLDRPPEKGWNYSTGFINKDMVAAHMPSKTANAASNDTLLLMCGPPPMIKFACEPAFKEVGFTEDEFFAF